MPVHNSIHGFARAARAARHSSCMTVVVAVLGAVSAHAADSSTLPTLVAPAARDQVEALLSATSEVPPIPAATEALPQIPAKAPPQAPGAAPASVATVPPADEVSPPAASVAPVLPALPRPSPPPAKQLFGAMTAPAQLEARAVGSYSRGCLAGARALPVDGPAWQAMRLSRNRNWGHPDLVALVEKFASEARAYDGWPGLLVGDISQPRGGPMLTGHASHQIGLDADIWFTPMPDRRLSAKEREELSAISMLSPDGLSVDPKLWSAERVQIIKRAASYPQVERVLVHPAIKQALCTAAGADRQWLSKVRPIYGHYYHFHIRIACPPGSAGCVPQKAPDNDDGCGKELADWFVLLKKPPAPPPAVPAKPPPQITLDELPPECRTVLEVGIPRPVEPQAGRGLNPSSAALVGAAAPKKLKTKPSGQATATK